MICFNIPSTFIKTKNHLNFFWSIFVLLSTQVHYICFHKHTSISHFMKWNSFFLNFLPRLYSTIICKNIMKIFQKFEVGYIQTCTSLENNTMWHPKRGHCSVLSPWIACNLHLFLCYYFCNCNVSTLHRSAHAFAY